MKHIALETTNLTIPDLAKLAKKGTVILTLRGKPLAAVKPLPGTDWESASLANNPRFLALIEESRKAYGDHGGQTLDEVRAELGLASGNSRKKPKRKAGKP